MELIGLTLSQVLATLAVAGGAVLFLYLLKLRRRLITVPFVRLWEQVLADKQTTRLLSRLRRLFSLLLALLLIGLLSLALGDPRWAEATDTGRTLVVLVDTSASMQATDGAPDRLSVARDHVRSMVAGLGPGDRMLVAEMATTTTPLTPMTGDPPVLHRAIEAFEAHDLTASLDQALHFARDVLRGQPGPEIVLVTDGRIEHADEAADALRDSGARLSWVRVGTEGRNLGITAFSVRRYPLDKSQSEVLVEIWNPTPTDEDVELTLLGDGDVIDVQQLRIPAGERIRRFFRNLSGVDRTLEARMTMGDGTRDALPADDRAFARLPERRRARVLAVSPGNLYLSAALLLDEYLEVVEVTPDEYPLSEDFDVVIFDGWVPPSAPAESAIYLNPISDDVDRGPFEIRGMIDRPFFDRIDRDDPLLQFTALQDVNVSQSLDVVLRRDDRIVAGRPDAPLIVSGRRNGHPMVAFAFDLRESDLPLRVAWPLLLLNAIDNFVQEDGEYVSSYLTGEAWHIPVDPGAQNANVVDPGGKVRTVPVVDGRAVYSGSEVGLYVVSSDVSGDASQNIVAANLGPSDETNIEPVDELTIGDTVATTPSEGRATLRREIWPYLVALVLLLLLVEWTTFHRQMTV